MNPEFSIGSIVLILLVASIVAMASRRIKLPYSVGLVLAGAGVSYLPAAVNIPLTRELIFSVFLPPLIFEAALQLHWTPFRRDLPLNGILAFVGVAIAAVAVAAGMHVIVGWTWMGAALFGVLISATDPVSVIAAFKELRVERRLQGIVESESLLNDGAAAVGFALLVAIAGGSSPSPLEVAGSLVWTIAGGVIIGLAVASAALLLSGRTQDHLVEITLTTVVAYGSFLLAERLHASGVLATLAAGLLIGNRGQAAISAVGRGHVMSFWEYVAFLANSFVFMLIGEQEAHTGGQLLTVAAAVAIGLVLIGRILAVYPLCALFARSSLAIDARYQHVLVWGGLRGALALALVLALPETVPERNEIVVVAFAVVAFSVIVQGLSMPWLVRKLALIADE